MITNLKSISNVHFIGIGGIGISAIARMMLMEGRSVTGSDRSGSLVTKELEKAGAKISIGQQAENILEGCDLIVYTVAIAGDNPELVEAKRRRIPMMTYPQALHEVSKEMFTIAISGTHGKTTVTAMIAKILIDAKLDPTVIVGSLLKEHNTNFISGKSDLFVVEADEYKNAFFNLEPSIFVINNLDLDHLDFFKDLEDIQRSFKKVAEGVPQSGFVICNANDPHVQPVIKGLACKVIDYGEFKDMDLKLQVTGKHNRSNAAAAYAVSRVLNVEDERAITSLEDFSGTWRRFEYKGEAGNGALVYDDYAHNPQKLRAALQGAREMFPDKKIVTIFQPHLYSRTKILLKDFAESFSDTDELILLPIYAARETNDPLISSDILAESIKVIIREEYKNKGKFLKRVSVAKDHNDAIALIPQDTEIIITMGAGDVTAISDILTK